MVPKPDELPEPVVDWIDAIPGERGVERINTAFEFLNPALDAIPDAKNADNVTDTERP